MFLSVIPSLKMPYGHAFFDYELPSGTAHVGDLILVPFRNNFIPGLVARLSPTSDYAGRAIILNKITKILKLPEYLPEFCIAAARESFVSPPTMLHSWLRVVPKKLADHETYVPPRSSHRSPNAKNIEEHWVINRFADAQGILENARREQANGRLLLLTPWQKRADYLAARLGCSSLNAQTAAGSAWRTWTAFADNPNSMLVTTRVGAWLACLADVVIVDEPENDDHKQDELTPRYDARSLTNLAAEHNPTLRIIKIGTTPPLDSDPQKILLAPEINADVSIFARVRGSGSQIECITSGALEVIQQAAEDKKPIRILHPVYGERGRVRCADCGWMLECSNCGYPMNNNFPQAVCRRCQAQEQIPGACPKCGGTELNKSIIGGTALQKKSEQLFPGANLQVLDLHQWLFQPLPPNSLAVITDVTLIGGSIEDIRKKERMIISFRRLAAQACVGKCKLVLQGSNEILDQCLDWLKPQGLQKAWSQIYMDRQAFEFPPACQLVKLISPGTPNDMDSVLNVLNQIRTNYPDWNYRGPFAVENLSKSRAPRCIFHIFPPKSLPKQEILDILVPLTALGILDLDPIAFFS